MLLCLKETCEVSGFQFRCKGHTKEHILILLSGSGNNVHIFDNFVTLFYDW